MQIEASEYVEVTWISVIFLRSNSIISLSRETEIQSALITFISLSNWSSFSLPVFLFSSSLFVRNDP